MPRSRKGLVGRGRSVGVAEHRTRTGLTRSQRATSVAVVLSALAFLTAIMPSPVSAQSTNDQVASLRTEVDSAAERWFSAQRDASRLDAEIQDLEQRIVDVQAKVARTQKTATARALLIYKGASTSMAIDGVVGDDAMDSARRAELIDRANEESHRDIDALNAATEDLAAKHDELESRRDAQTAALDAVASERGALDKELAALEAKAGREAAPQVRRVTRVRVTRLAAAPTRPVSSAPAPRITIAPVVTTTSTVSASGGSHHNDPFLACTRMRESSGNYGAVSPSGYYGAYQFAPTTWNATAVHAGRMDLVGVLPSKASPADQDALAWVLYQWQGKDPWGGRC